ncbi:MAG: SusC/RagA family TonB-linked outer membrane protein [Bacteroidetes bacterium HGW-Bacteroidetes-13]|nr:MAG: SusC/RagA family TonB-linked outer membrane protein [Bacteroidetes bacterium HGW-Bacteroidetes-13]
MSKIKLLLIAISLSICNFAVAQTKFVKGTVKDDTGAPVPGVTILVAGTTKGTSTDFDGNYTIEASATDRLTFSFVGLASQTITVGNQSTIDVTLLPSAEALAEVVVTGYSTQSTRDITGSVSVIKSEDLLSTSPNTLEQALQGQASGVVVNVEGGPGGNASIRIRGFGTVNGNDPLFIIDGTPTGLGLNAINPNDIESIQILKDASSAAIYGNRAANGVVLITTKGGKKNQKVTFNGNAHVSVDYVPSTRFPELANPTQLANAVWQASINDTGTTPSHPQFGNGPTPVLPVYLNPIGASSGVDESQYDFLTNRITRANQAGTNFFDEFFNTQTSRSYNIDASGGSENASFFMSLSALEQNGVAKFTDFERYTIRTNSNFNITDKIRMGENLTVSYSDRIGAVDTQNPEGAIAALLRINPIIPVYDVGGNFAGSGVGGGIGNSRNPIAVAFRNKDNHDLTFRAFGNAFLEIEPIKNLKLRTNIGIDLNSFNSSNFTPFGPEGETAVVNSLTEFNLFERVFTWYNTASYKYVLNEKHVFEGLVGTEFNKRNVRFFSATRNGFLFNEPLNTRVLDIGTTNINNSGNAIKTAYYSVFGKLDYKYDDKYLVSGTLRYDSSSKFSSNNRSDTFAAFSLGWRISNEEFLKDNKIITDLMLKGGWGELGNDGNISARAISDIFSPNLDFNSFPTGPKGLQPGNGLTSRGNPDLKWETTTTVNFGFSATLLEHFTLDVEYYDSRTNDVLLAVPGDPTILGNVNTITKNFGKLSNEGFDISAGYSNQTAGGFKYSVNANLSHYDNTVDFLDPDNAASFIDGVQFRTHQPNRTQAGHPLASFFGKKFTGIGADGRMQFADTNGDGVSNNDDQTFIGNPHPNFTFGLNFSANYKNFDFSMLWQGSVGNDIYNFNKFFTDFNTFPGGKSVKFVNQDGLPNLTNNVDIINLESFQSDFFIEDGSYARMKNIQVGYTLPKNITDKLGINLQAVRFYGQGINLITIAGYSGLDPEISLTDFSGALGSNLTLGVDSGAYPITRSLVFGVDISF